MCALKRADTRVRPYRIAALLEAVDKNVKIGFPGEEGNPLDHRAGDEVQTAWFSDGIAASHGA